jgi:hypothetical protein
MMASDYVSKLHDFLSSRQTVNRHSIFLHLSEPWRNMQLRNELTAPMRGQFLSPNHDLNRLTQSIISIWTSPDTFSACVNCLSLFGSQIKQSTETEPYPLVRVSVLVSFLQALSSLGRKLCHSPSSSQTLLDALRLEYAHLRRDAKTDLDKQVGMVICLIEIIKICIFDSSANPGIVDSLLASTQGILSFESGAEDSVQFPKSVSTSYYFYLAKHLLFLDNFDGAREQLEKALSLTPTHPVFDSVMYRNKQRILWHLIPLKLVQGTFPTKNLLKTYPDIDRMYRPILNAIRHKDLDRLRKNLNGNRSLVNTFFTLFRKLDNWVYRGIVKEIWNISKETRRVDFGLFSNIMGNLDEGLTEEILGNLIREGLINGYLSYEERTLLLTGSNPFP